MKVLFSNPPWWLEQFTINDNGASHDMCLAGIRAGSRWPHTIHTHSTPDNFIFGGYLPYPFFMGYATTYAARATGAQVVMRDSLALRATRPTSTICAKRTTAISSSSQRRPVGSTTARSSSRSRKWCRKPASS